jgi:hypothetical protein
MQLTAPAPGEVMALSAAAAADRLGITRTQLQHLARTWQLEATFSVDEVAEHLGCGKWQVQELVRLGRIHGQALHPSRGGLHPTFKPSHKSRRIPLSAIERHKRHMARVHDGVLA